MIDWKSCLAVEQNPGKVSDTRGFAGARIPLFALYENLAGGATVDEFTEWFPSIDQERVLATPEYESQALGAVQAQ